MDNKLPYTSTTTREFTFQFLEQITDHFSEKCIIGSGGFGVVYKGVLDDGEEIAVKKLLMPWLADQQFNNEFNNLAKAQHQNIIKLVGFCNHSSKEMVTYDGKQYYADVEERALCLEYLQGGSLDKHLSDESCGLDWQKRYNIIKGICDGLFYLHTAFEEPIYHLDLKPENILLDEDMAPKIGDFGLSKLLASRQTYSTKNIKGTYGYMPPEYIQRNKISNKYDVFSLGVIIIQIIAGREGYSRYGDMSSQEFVGHVHKKWAKRLKETMETPTFNEVRICLQTAIRCVEANREKRPTITDIVAELRKINSAESSHMDETFLTVAPEFDLKDLAAIKVVGKSVLLVRHKETGQFLTRKIIRGGSTNAHVRKQITLGLKISLSTKSESVVMSFHPICDCNGLISMLSEYMDGGSLADFIGTVGTIPERFLAAICKQVLEGLMYLHDEMHVIHRDLKPSKILINHTGEVKISSIFNVCAKVSSSLSRSDSFIGTFNYMAPERISGQAHDCLSDIWSLGLIIVECATGKFPYPPRESFYELLEAVVDQPSPSAPADQFSEEFCSFFSACMQKEASHRPSAQVLSVRGKKTLLCFVDSYSSL
ncbi:unnamed protein product [Triticum turgidum subsp. durum]|uniref:mitogen-activated protein kinase kinase n=1 Tax=Triticum turgidum subsp. durum TaxID=4567 RepID=A0A9R0YBG3_TRITD|nr:unnamed protein product [Triticum turgidum subsp. durum]